MRELAKEARHCMLLAQMPLFRAAASAAGMAYASAQCHCCAFAAGEELPAARRVALVCKGEIRAFRGDAGGKDLLLNCFAPGELFGVAAAFLEQGGLSRLAAQTDSELLFLELPLLRELLRRYPAVAENYICYLSGRVSFLTQRLGMLGGGTAAQQLLAWLAAQPVDAQGWVSLPDSYSALADMLGMGRASLYRALDELRRAKRLEQEGRRLRLRS